VAAVQRALNFALETAGQKERFVAEERGGQIGVFVFAEPAAFLPIALRYWLPLSRDLDEAMRKGKEFEQKVLNPSREQPTSILLLGIGAAGMLGCTWLRGKRLQG
jgi:hypothetical protein